MLIRPRLTDYYNVHIPQSELDFAIPFLNEDIPLYVDPFLMWKSPSLQDKGLHRALISAFNNLGTLAKAGQRGLAISQLIAASECDEVGLGSSANRTGRQFGQKLASEILHLFEHIEYYRNNGVRHLEEIQLLVSGINKDRISDMACSFLKSFLIDYTIQECKELRIPMTRTIVPTCSITTHLYLKALKPQYLYIPSMDTLCCLSLSAGFVMYHGLAMKCTSKIIVHKTILRMKESNSRALRC